MQHDENGNPIDISAYRQMRELASKPTDSVFSSKKHSNYGIFSQHGEFRETSNFDYSFQGHSVKDLEDGASNSDRKKLRKKTQHKEPVKLAEDIPNYVGNLANVDDLVKFITTHNIGEKQLKKKIGQKTSPSSEPAPKADKLNKKSKEKKGKVGVAEESSDNHSVVLVNSSLANTITDIPCSSQPQGDILSQPAIPEVAQQVEADSVGESKEPDFRLQPAEADIILVSSPADTTTLPTESDINLQLSETDISLHPTETNGNQSEEKDMGNSGDKAAVTSLTESPNPPEEHEHAKPKKVEARVGLNKDINTPTGKESSSKSPPLQKREIEYKDKNKTKAKEKEKPLETTPPLLENKRQKGKNGKPEGHLKNNKKLEGKNDMIPESKPIDTVKTENVPSKLMNKLDSDLAINENQDYIFTDIDSLPPVEQEFTLVSKKKKRPGVKEVVPDFPRPKNGPREYRGLPPPRSVTPPPSSMLRKEQTRDLSPSSFPALGKKANVSKIGPAFREGRRNSFGDVPVDTLTELRSQDDSDIESVKSLPAAKGGSLSDIVSSRFPVSYAKIAAAPKPPHSPTSPKSDEDPDDLFQSGSTSSRKTTVWKGSPTERRHSIGSSPEDTKQENSPKLSQRSRQKSGSQEFLLSDSVKAEVDVPVPAVVVDMQSSSVSVSNVKNVSGSNSCNVESEETVTGVSPRSQVRSQEATHSIPTNSPNIPTITVTLDSTKGSSDIVLKVNNNQNGPKKMPLNGPLNGPQNGPQNGPPKIVKTEVLNYTDMSRSHQTVSSGSVSKDPRSKNVSVRINNNNNKKNNKSVIFLDKRFSDAPENLGITFGFDSNLDNDVEGACDNKPDTVVKGVHQDSISQVKKETVIHNQSELQSKPMTIPKDKDTKSETSSVATSSQAPHTTASSSTPNSSTGSVVLPNSASPATTTSNKISKTQVGSLNGIVLPKTQGYRNSNQGSDVLRTEQAASSEFKTSAANKDKTKTVFFFYGEGIVVKSESASASIDSSRDEHPVASQHKGNLAFFPEAVGCEGKFNVNEAIKYLKQEWDRVLEEKDRNPKAVQFYNGQ